ncbi:guanylate kinase [Candidatus Saccharibacteria bacterium CG_4_10_14_0_2_um_filter_52_9]|nr:MAG: guanylate kinase [Candidatus Saccharibacteria bacterium CG_4_10_14_0_2_um_filter_52_9]
MDQTLAEKLANYKPTEGAAELIKQTPILLLVGPTGAGKDSLKQKLMETGKYHHIISHTTRPPRINHGVIEQDGKDYHFIDKGTAERILDKQALIEAKIYSGNLYGTSLAEIQAAHDEGKIAMTDIEVQGVAEYKALDPNVMAVFLLPPSFQIWQERLQRRYGDVVDAADSRLRMETALEELSELLSTDSYVAVINDDLDQAVAEVEAVTTSPDHKSPDEAAARAVAQQLAHDIQAYLISNA